MNVSKNLVIDTFKRNMKLADEGFKMSLEVVGIKKGLECVEELISDLKSMYPIAVFQELKEEISKEILKWEKVAVVLRENKQCLP